MVPSSSIGVPFLREWTGPPPLHRDAPHKSPTGGCGTDTRRMCRVWIQSHTNEPQGHPLLPYVFPRSSTETTVYIMARASFASWMMEGLFIINTIKLPSVLYKSRDALVDTFGYETDRLPLCFLILLSMGVFWRCLSFIAIHFANAKQRR